MLLIIFVPLAKINHGVIFSLCFVLYVTALYFQAFLRTSDLAMNVVVVVFRNK